ncbi:MAG: hypothetical protein U0X75_26795 [Acidobacteriota bacterium]
MRGGRGGAGGQRLKLAHAASAAFAVDADRRGVIGGASLSGGRGKAV